MKLGDFFEASDELVGTVIAVFGIALVFIFCVGPCASVLEQERTKREAVERATTIEGIKKALQTEVEKDTK